jgi:hypothetical protein
MPLGFTLRRELADRTPADPPTVCTAVSNWRVGDVIPVPRGRDLRVIATAAGAAEDEDQAPVLVVEDA